MNSTHSAYTCTSWHFSWCCHCLVSLFHNHSISTCYHPLLHALTLRWHLFCTFRIGRLYKPCFSAKQKAHRSCPAGGASPGGSEFADVQLGGCHMSVQEYARLSALPWASVPQLPIRGHWQATTNSAHTTAQTPRVRCSLHLSASVDVSDSMTA